MKYKMIKLIHGIVIVPENYIVVEAAKKGEADYAGIIAEKNGTLPHFLVLSSKPIEEYSGEEENAIYDLCEKIYPKMSSVRKKEVEAVWENRRVINAEEWEKAPQLVLFAIREVTDKNNLYCNTGIIREG